MHRWQSAGPGKNADRLMVTYVQKRSEKVGGNYLLDKAANVGSYIWFDLIVIQLVLKFRNIVKELRLNKFQARQAYVLFELQSCNILLFLPVFGVNHDLSLIFDSTGVVLAHSYGNKVVVAVPTS